MSWDLSEFSSNVSYDVATVDIQAVKKYPNDDYFSIHGDTGRQSLTVGENVFEIYVADENNYIRTYILTITRAVPSNDNTLSSLAVTSETLTPEFTTDNFSYTVNTAQDVTSVTIDILASNEFAVVSGDIGVQVVSIKRC